MNRPLHEDQPIPGFYRYRRHKTARWEPVAIWIKEGALVCRVADRMMDPLEIWTWVADNKVEKDAARFAFENGRWADEPEEPARNNLPDDPFEALKAEIEDKLVQAEDYLTKNPEIKSQETCNLFRNLQAQLLALNKRADGMHEVEKRPILEAQRACDDKFRFRATVKVITERLRSRFEAFLKSEERRLREEAEAKFRAEQERVAKERQRIEAERAQKLASDPVAALTETPPELPPVPIAPEQVKVQAGGGFGRKAGLQTVWVPQIVDYQAALAHFSEHPDVKAVVERLVKHVVKDSKGSAKIPGVNVIEDRKVA